MTEREQAVEAALGALWRLIEKGYICTYDPDAESECEFLESIARDALKAIKDIDARTKE